MRHPEIQEDKREVTPEPPQIIGPDETPRTSRHIRDLGVDHSPSTRRNYAKIAKAFEAQETALSAAKARIASLEEEVARLKRGKKRKAVPNPNRRFMDVAEALVAGDPIPPIKGAPEPEVEVQEEELVVVGAPESHSEDDDESELLRLKPWARNMGFTALIADCASRRAKYMQALALDLPCVHFRWVADCVKEKRVLPKN